MVTEDDFPRRWHHVSELPKDGSQIDVLFAAVGWACPMVGMVNCWAEGPEFYVYDQQHDKFYSWDSMKPTLWFPRPNIPKGEVLAL